MSRIFISHSSRDGRDFADQLVSELEALGRRCWIAPRNMMPAIPYPEQIVNAISDSLGLVLVLTSEANLSLDVLQEVAQAHHERKLIAAVTFKDTEPSKNLIYYLRVRQQIVWTEARAVAVTLREVFVPAGAEGENPASAPEPASPPQPVNVASGEPPLPAPPPPSRLVAGPLPPHLIKLAQDPDPEIRLLAVERLVPLLAGTAEYVARAAQQALERLAADSSPSVGAVAAAALRLAFVTPSYKAGDVFRDGPDYPELVVILPGSFMMGSPSGEPGRQKDEGPAHAVTLQHAFAVGKYPVTRREWRHFVEATGRQGGGWLQPGFDQDERHPVVKVSWQDACDYLAWLSQRTRHEYRLLSEAEHEYINRAGSTAAFWWGESMTELPLYANCDVPEVKKRYRYTSPVGSYKATRFGLHDTSGNVWCWTLDTYHGSYDGAPADGSAWTEGGAGRVIRGGSWHSNPVSLRSARRSWRDEGCHYSGLGFRAARTL